MNLEYVLPFTAIIISILAWHKNRAVYEIVLTDDRPTDGKSGIEKINELLKSGRYTILHVKQDVGTNVLRTIYVLGKIKK